MATRTSVRTHVVRAGVVAETWNTRQGQVRKATVRGAKGQPGAGTFHGATNLRGTVQK